jgi:protein SCO1/2
MGLALDACGSRAPFHATVISDPVPASPITVRDSRGSLFDLGREKGKVVLVYFGYTHCPDVCPTTLADFARARKLLSPAQRSVLRFAFVSVDPGRDTPAAVEQYAWQFDSSFVGLAPTEAQVDSIKMAWGFAAGREPGDDPTGKAYGVMHPAGVFLIDKEGLVRLVFSPGTKVEDIVEDLRRVL